MTEIAFHIDQASWLVENSAAIGIYGWCADRKGIPWRTIEARRNGEFLATASPRERPDVEAHLGRASARWSGFELLLPFVELTDQLTVIATLADNTETKIHASRAGDLPGRSAVITNYPALRASGWGDASRPLTPVTVSQTDSALEVASLPSFSIIVPVFNTPACFLEECLQSVINQSYPHWELCVINDASDRGETKKLVADFAARDTRIRIEDMPMRSGIARATNRGLEIARGDFLVFLDHDDRLHRHAVEHFASAILAANSSSSHASSFSQFSDGRFACDVLYSDEEKVSETGEPSRPVLKPAFSPEFLRGVMYVGHLLCVRRTVAIEAGGFDSRFDGIQDYEFILRVSERTRRILHVSEILYQWRISPGSSAFHGNIKGDMDSLHVRAVEEHLVRIKRHATVRAAGNHRATIGAPLNFVRPPVTLFVTGEAAISSALTGLVGVDFKITTREHIDRLWEQLEHAEAGIRLVGVVAEPLLETSPGWLDQLACLALESETNRVSPVIRSVEGKILESGSTVAANGAYVPIMRGYDPESDGYHGSLKCNREVDAVSPVVWMIRRDGTTSESIRFDRVCSTSWIRLERSFIEPPLPPCAIQMVPFSSSSPRFFNHRFHAQYADYRLAP